MYFSTAVVFYFLLGCCKAATIQHRSKDQPEGFRKFFAGRSDGDLSHGAIVPLSRGVSTTRRFRRDDTHSSGSPLTAVARNLLADVTVGRQTFKVVIDTGSSDSWVAAAKFTCTDAKSRSVDQKTCNMGTLYTQSAGVEVVPRIKLNQTYASGEFVFGPMVREKISVGGVTVQNAQIGAIEYAFWRGDGVNSGLLGLSGPVTTTAQDGNRKQVIYNPVFQEMVQQNVSQPFFSMSIDTVSSGPAGFLVFGGLPPVAHDKTFTTVPIIKKSGSFQGPLPYPQVVDYIIAVPSFTVDGKVMAMNNLEMVVDSGTFANIVPNDLADQINGLWNPPATFNENRRLYAINCAATAPDVGITLNGKEFLMPSKAAVLKDGTECFSAWTGGGMVGKTDKYFVLGDIFMKSVVSVFDLGTAEMHFAARL
ncbi:uncharacterized protein RAG0_09795 [Rhynchosporium agropyri]|uniref:Peptidase A1 domain-containing protein n=1 Tax=Rhynchosporium agropyri TaxID=914238 RepID=A0A1E1KX12_9HELO|nr:uncharacterized protein RAG0_09795 [Rhynchosporium agropyri]